jgi:hypothetical protein
MLSQYRSFLKTLFCLCRFRASNSTAKRKLQIGWGISSFSKTFNSHTLLKQYLSPLILIHVSIRQRQTG